MATRNGQHRSTLLRIRENRGDGGRLSHGALAGAREVRFQETSKAMKNHLVNDPSAAAEGVTPRGGGQELNGRRPPPLFAAE